MYVTHNDVDKLLILCLPFLIWFHCNVHVMNVLSSAFCYFCPVCVDAFILGKMQDGNMENNQTKGNLLYFTAGLSAHHDFIPPFTTVQLVCLFCFSCVCQGSCPRPILQSF